MSLDKKCDSCTTPIIQVQYPARRPFRMCLDPLCKTKKDWLDKKKRKKAKEESIRSKKLAEKFTCKTCKKPFQSKRSLTLHKKTHEK